MSVSNEDLEALNEHLHLMNNQLESISDGIGSISDDMRTVRNILVAFALVFAIGSFASLLIFMSF